MPRGGARVGAGRKPKGTPRVLGLDGLPKWPSRVPLPPALAPEEKAELLQPPDDLPEHIRECWKELAPHAIEQRTLTPATEAGFVELCIRLSNVRAMDKRIAHLGIQSQDALPYLKERRGQAAQLGISLKDFKLTAFGKPATSEKPKPAANPWEAIASGQGR